MLCDFIRVKTDPTDNEIKCVFNWHRYIVLVNVLFVITLHELEVFLFQFIGINLIYNLTFFNIILEL